MAKIALLATLLLVCLLQVHAFSGVWIKLNHGSVCFQAKSNKPGLLLPRHQGFLAAVKLVHKSGYVSCAGWSYRSHWGCKGLAYPLNMFVTNAKNQVIFPRVGMKFWPGNAGRWYSMDGFDSMSNDLVLQYGFDQAYYITPKSVLKVWYGEDLYGYTESDNRGKVCADVYGYFI
ncbi:predicted protein [Nematostella vectensis]|uniref:Uncharacterized protein n=1 Tax=Nematostella vectensis TaxID=45351 RepID=A7S4R8_NEMVE|nr:predicted protein [Nematostella vectensis]|eukprot:XP_001633396.1 predicted protein [Nematostella vectensis]